jgi:hypothetical protein
MTPVSPQPKQLSGRVNTAGVVGLTGKTDEDSKGTQA